jgi:hypothetical protein
MPMKINPLQHPKKINPLQHPKVPQKIKP